MGAAGKDDTGLVHWETMHPLADEQLAKVAEREELVLTRSLEFLDKINQGKIGGGRTSAQRPQQEA